MAMGGNPSTKSMTGRGTSAFRNVFRLSITRSWNSTKSAAFACAMTVIIADNVRTGFFIALIIYCLKWRQANKQWSQFDSVPVASRLRSEWPQSQARRAVRYNPPHAVLLTFATHPMLSDAPRAVEPQAVE